MPTARIRERLEQLRDEVGRAHGVVVDEDRSRRRLRLQQHRGSRPARSRGSPCSGRRSRRETASRASAACRRSSALSTTTTSTGTVWASRLATASASSPQAFHVGMTTTGRMRQGTIRECVASSCGPPIPSGSRWRAPGSATTASRPSSPERFDVTLVAPGDGHRGCAVHVSSGRVRAVRARVWRRMSSWRRACRSASSAASAGPVSRLVFDLYAPALVEAAANIAEERAGSLTEASATRRSSRRPAWRSCSETHSSARASGSATTGWARSRRSGRLSPEVYADDPALRSLVAVVPFGLDPAPPGSAPSGEGRAARDRPRPTGCCSGAEGSGTGSIR